MTFPIVVRCGIRSQSQFSWSNLPLSRSEIDNCGMTARVFPPNPIFRSPGERAVFESLLPQLSDEDVLFANLEISDPVEGDVEIDLAVLLKDHGLVVIEVKGGHITHNGTDWIQSGPDGSHPIYPVSQARRNMYTLRDYIQRKWSLGTMRASWVVAFPHCNIADPKDPALPIDKIIQKSQLERSLSQLKNVANKERDVPLPQYADWVNIALRNIQPIVVQKTNPEAILGNNYEFIRSLTHEREMVLDQLSENNRYYVKGPAGSGKSWLAFEQAKRWTLEGKKVAVLAYNRGIVSYLHLKNEELPECQRINWIGTFHDFASYIGSFAGNPKNFSDEVDRYRDDLISKSSLLLAEEKFDAFVVDEAQDFLPAWWEVIDLSLRDQTNGQIALFGDDQQQVFGYRPAPSGNYSILRLMENLRNSQQIAHAVSSLIEKPSIARGPHSFEIEYVTVDSYDDVFETADDQIAKLVDEENWGPREIALLTTCHRHPEHESRAEKDRSDHWRSLWEDDDVFYCTVGGFKGLERPVVVLAVDGFHDDVDPSDVLYVGMSRARDKLVIVSTFEHINFIQQTADKAKTSRI